MLIALVMARLAPIHTIIKKKKFALRNENISPAR